MTKDLTTGRPLRLIVSFAIPVLAGLLFQQLYQFADAIVVGRMIGMNALAAVGASGSIVFLIIGFTMGVTNGFAIPVSRAFGAGDTDALRRFVAVGVVLSAAVTLTLTGVGIPLSRQLLVLLDTPTELVSDATVFLTVILAGCAALVAFNFLSGIIRALGDSTTPLIFLAISSLLNIVLVVALIGWAGMGVGGAALATVISQLTTVAACLALVRRKMPLLVPRREDWRLRRSDISESLSLGLPMGLQMSIIAVGTLVLQYAINELGADAVAAFTAGSRIDGLAMTPFQAFGLAVATFVAQNRGAGQWSRITRGVKQTSWLVVAIAVVTGAVCITWGTHMIEAFAGGDPQAEQIVATAHMLLVVNGFLYAGLGLLFVFRNALQGLGHSGVPTLSGVVELVLRAGAALVLVDLLGFLGAVLAAPLAWYGALIPLSVSWRRRHRELRGRTDFVPATAAAATASATDVVSEHGALLAPAGHGAAEPVAVAEPATLTIPATAAPAVSAVADPAVADPAVAGPAVADPAVADPASVPGFGTGFPTLDVDHSPRVPDTAAGLEREAVALSN